MAWTLTARLRLDVLGVPVAATPTVYTDTYDCVVAFVDDRHTDDVRHPLPVEALRTIRTLAVRTDTAVDLYLAEQNTGHIPLAAGGCCIIVNGRIDARPHTNVRLVNAGGTTAHVAGVAAGEPA